MLVDGDFAEQVFLPSLDGSLLQTLQTWKRTEAHCRATRSSRDRSTTCSSCSATSNAQSGWNASVAAGLSPSIATSALNQVCRWPFLPAVASN